MHKPELEIISETLSTFPPPSRVGLKALAFYSSTSGRIISDQNSVPLTFYV